MTQEERNEILRKEYGKAGMDLDALASRLGHTAGTIKVYSLRMGLYKNTIFDVEPDEEWKSLSAVGFSNYRISNYGKVINNLGQLLSSSPHHQSGYLQIRLINDLGERSTRLVHVLVANAFLGEKSAPHFQVDHIDGDRKNPALSNLQWLTNIQNQHKSKKANRPHRLLTENEVRDICEMLEKGFSYSQIMKQNSFYTKSKIESIKQKKAWCEITKDYCY